MNSQEIAMRLIKAMADEIKTIDEQWTAGLVPDNEALAKLGDILVETAMRLMEECKP